MAAKDKPFNVGDRVRFNPKWRVPNSRGMLEVTHIRRRREFGTGWAVCVVSIGDKKPRAWFSWDAGYFEAIPDGEVV